MENLTHSKTRIGPKRLKLVGIKNLWMVRVLFEESSIRPTKRGQKQWYWWNNERRLVQSSVVRIWWELHICGWFGCYLKDIHSDQPNEARGQSWSWRSDDHSVKMISNQILWPFPGPRILGQRFWKKVPIRGQKQWYRWNWSDWRFFKKYPNHP